MGEVNHTNVLLEIAFCNFLLQHYTVENTNAPDRDYLGRILPTSHKIKMIT